MFIKGSKWTIESI